MQHAMHMVKLSTGQIAEDNPKPATPNEISRVMAEMGRRGGKIGGKARAEKLTQQERSRIASHAAQKRWHKDDKKSDGTVLG